jgi:hypothetical protein
MPAYTEFSIHATSALSALSAFQLNGTLRVEVSNRQQG